jgi:hypothetical protein
VFAAFIPTCDDEDTLNGFYAKNKTAIAYLKEQKPDLHKQVVAAFASRKAEIKAAKA